MKLEEVKTLEDLALRGAEEYKGKAYLREKAGDGFKDESFEDFYKDILKIGSYLKEAGGGEKLHAGLIGTSSIGYFICMYGTAVSGNVAVPIDPQLSVEEVGDNLNRADVTVFFYDARFKRMIETLKEICPGIKTFVCINGKGSELEDLLKKYEPAEPVHPEPDSCACILYTSGTTGKSKGVMLSHGNLVDNAMCCDDEATTEDVMMTMLPIHHAYCLTCDFLLALKYGVTLCINDSLMHIVQNIKLFKPTMLLMVPMIVETIYRKMMAAKKEKRFVPMFLIKRAVFGKQLKCIYCGGAYLSPDLTKAFRKMGIPLLQDYGMTECSPRITSASLKEPTVGDEVGHIVKRCEVKIVDGEVWARSPSVMLGYYKNEEATKEILTEDGWLKTGDLGYVEGNRVYLTGRKKNLIILSNGENISPEELENKFANLEWMQEILVYSEEEQITAEVYPFPEFKDQAEELFKKKVAEINKTVPPSKRILRLRLRDREFEKTTSKKVKRIQPGEKGRLI